jgi:hypothetical protein
MAQSSWTLCGQLFVEYKTISQHVITGNQQSQHQRKQLSRTTISIETNQGLTKLSNQQFTSKRQS